MPLIGCGALLALFATVIFFASRRPADGEEHLGRGIVGTLGYGVAFFTCLSVIAYGVFLLLTQ